MKKYLILFFLILLVIILLIVWMGWKGYQLQKGEISITTDKTEYEPGGILKVKIKNNFKEQICFSSCYPYLLESKNENWESYKYAECQEFDGNGHCMKAGELKAFELTLPEVSEGLHRLAIPICIGCKSEDTFKEEKRFYSNEFTIKEKVEEGKVAESFCQDKGMILKKEFLLNFDNDEDLEIAVLCGEGTSNGGLKMGLYVLDKQDYEYKLVLEEERIRVAQHEVYFENLKGEDIDKNGIDEILFREDYWGALGGCATLFLYSPHYNEWFSKSVCSEYLELGERKIKTELSPNLASEKYKVFKDFLLQQEIKPII